MRTDKIGNNYVEYYDSIEDLPSSRFYKYNKLLLIDAGIGSDSDDLSRHLERAIRYSRTDPKKTATELENLRMAIHFMQSEISPKHLAFAALVKSINGTECSDLSDEGLQRTKALLDEANSSIIFNLVDSIKKKLDTELNSYFPKYFDDASLKEYFDLLRKKALLELSEIIDGEVDVKELERVTDALIVFSDPETFTGKNSFEIRYDKQYEETCILISHKLNVDAKTYTVMAFYNALAYLTTLQKTNGK